MPMFIHGHKIRPITIQLSNSFPVDMANMLAMPPFHLMIIHLLP
jgi:hypothetical protein